MRFKLTQSIQAPINEVAIAFTIKPSGFDIFKQSKFGDFVKDRFPKNNVLNPIATQGGAQVQFVNKPEIRTWYVSANDETLLQLQSDRFVYNWRRVTAASSYPGFINLNKNVSSELENYLNWFSSYDKNIREKLELVEVTYTNHFDETAGWRKPADIANILSENLVSNFSEFGELRNNTFQVQLHNKEKLMEIFVVGRPGLRGSDKKPIYMLEITLRLKGLHVNGVSQALKDSSQTINSIFKKVLNKDYYSKLEL